MDRRDISETFRARLAELVAQSGLRQGAFAARIGIDRSALSQLLAGAGARLPRADTLVAIADTFQVSVDWLLGLSEDAGITSQTRDALEVAQGDGESDQALLAQWHEEARGAKIRYVPAGLPDFLRTEAVERFERRAVAPDGEHAATGFRRDYIRFPGSDIECALPMQTLEIFAAGAGVWRGLDAPARRAQIDHMRVQIAELYPALRVHLFDGRERFSMPYTLFGHQRAAIYAGEIYLLVNARPTLMTLISHFDNLVRAARVEAQDVAEWLARLEIA